MAFSNFFFIFQTFSDMEEPYRPFLKWIDPFPGMCRYCFLYRIFPIISFRSISLTRSAAGFASAAVAILAAPASVAALTDCPVASALSVGRIRHASLAEAYPTSAASVANRT